MFAFEADKKNYEDFKSTCAANNVSFVFTAVSNVDGEIMFSSSVGQFPYSGSIFEAEPLVFQKYPTMRFKSPEKVPCTTLDTFCKKEGISGIDLIYMDVQSAEATVLEGLHDIRPKVIYCETCAFKEYKSGMTEEAFDALMEGKGYHVIERLPGNTLYKYNDLKLEDIKIHCIGDSHVSVFNGMDKISENWPCPWDSIPYFSTYRLGPVLAYNLVTPGHHSMSNLFHILGGLPKESYVLLSFGEIDCRMHLIRQKEIQKKPLEALVQECVHRYFQTLLEVKNKGFKVIVWGIPGTSNVDCFELKDESTSPHYGTYVERNQAIRFFNNELSALCKTNGMYFLSIFEELVDEANRTKVEEYYMDLNHVGKKAMPLIIKKIKKLLSVR